MSYARSVIRHPRVFDFKGMVMRHQRVEPLLAAYISYCGLLLNLEDYCVVDGVLYHNLKLRHLGKPERAAPGCLQIVVPRALREFVLRGGTTRAFWRGIQTWTRRTLGCDGGTSGWGYDDVVQWVRSCIKCARRKRGGAGEVRGYIPGATPPQPFQ